MQHSWIKFDKDKETWNSFVEKNSFEFRQLYEWGEYKKKLGWDLLRLVCEKDNKIEASAQILVKKSFIVGNVFIPGGICGNIKNLDDSFKRKIQEILQVSFLYIRIDFTEKEKNLNKECLIKNGFKRPLYMLNSLEYCELDLRKDNAQILSEAKQKWRYNHKKSLEKEIVLTIETKSEDYISLNEELTSEWQIRNNFKEREVVPLIEELGSKLITCTAKDKFGNLLGIRVAVVSGGKAFHLYNAVSKKGRAYIPGYRLLIFMLDVLRDRGIENFNIGSTNQERFPGPYRFKVGIGYKNSLYTSLGEWNYTNSLFQEIILNIFIKMYFNSSPFLRKFIKNF